MRRGTDSELANASVSSRRVKNRKFAVIRGERITEVEASMTVETKSQNESTSRPVGRDTIRSRLVLELAAELVDQPGWAERQARVSLRVQGADRWPINLIASDGPAATELVAKGEMQLAISNPAMYLALAVRGTGPFKSPIPLRAITIIPSPDQLAFAVTEQTGLKSLHDIRERRFPLRVSMRGQKDHALHPIIDEVFAAAGFSLDDIVSWGGQVRYDDGLPMKSNRFGAMQRGEVDMIVDEAVRGWINAAAGAGMRALPLDEAMLTKLENLGLRRAVIPKERYPNMPEDVPALDFSGFAVYTHANVPDTVVSGICAALEARKDRIGWQEPGPLPLEKMCRDTADGPLVIPLHPAAEKFWRERGYLT
ncbi:MAG TPA: TAXI family TRAP transporter solute-binding subunit, partial [Terriglobales bacterium]|nr:TAXI family TRAP transporter solute-binding subunit [Terriglobales bacterium]